MQPLIDSISRAKTLLAEYLIAHGKQANSVNHGLLARDWSDLERSLSHSLEAIALNNRQVREALETQGMETVRQLAGETRPRRTEPPPPPLTAKEQQALDFIKRSKGKAKAIVVANHIGVTERTFLRHYVKKLRPHGVKNDRKGDGYYVEVV